MVLVPAWLVPHVLRRREVNGHYRSRENAEAHLAELVGQARTALPPKSRRRDVTLTTSEWQGRPLHCIRPSAKEAAGSVVYLHGGGWVHEIHLEHWRLAEEMAARAGAAVYLPMYPLIHEGGTGAEVAQSVAQLVRELGPRTVLAGDSAGAQIAFSAAVCLRNEGWSVPQTVLISPPIDLELVHDDIAAHEALDPWLSRDGLVVYSKLWLGERGFDDPMLNPINADPAGLGPITLFTGTYDVLNLNARDWAAKLRAAGVEVEFHEERGQVHVYPLVPTRAGRAARRQIFAKLVDTFESN